MLFSEDEFSKLEIEWGFDIDGVFTGNHGGYEDAVEVSRVVLRKFSAMEPPWFF